LILISNCWPPPSYRCFKCVFVSLLFLLWLIPTYPNSWSGQVISTGNGVISGFHLSEPQWVEVWLGSDSWISKFWANFQMTDHHLGIPRDIVETWKTLEPRKILRAPAPFSEHGSACQPAGERWSPSQALASVLVASLSVFYWEPTFYDWSTSGVHKWLLDNERFLRPV